jgi:hypothetical protein
MKKMLVVFLLTIFSFLSVGFLSKAEAATRVRGYYKKSSGTYVNSYYRSSRDTSFYNNYSTKGNYNPYTGKRGTKTYRYSY